MKKIHSPKKYLKFVNENNEIDKYILDDNNIDLEMDFDCNKFHVQQLLIQSYFKISKYFM